MPKKLTTKQFIEKAKKVHGDRYDYSLAEYVLNSIKIKIICPIHGIFEQRPYSHLNGAGCPSCISTQTTEQFIEKVTKIHKNKYDYSLTNYQGSKNNVKIICPKHGVFEQSPGAHLSGSGCKKCANRFLDKENFIEKARRIHGKRYDYSLVEYQKSNIKVKIICSIHGIFEQTPNGHLMGRGCSKCRGQRLTQKDFIKKAKKVHGNKFDYSKVNFINGSTKITIICKVHGEFQCTPNKHYHNKKGGCPKCLNRASNAETFIEKAKDIHGGKYNYSLVNYTYASEKVKIICPKHGMFEMSPNSHLSGYGCKKCNYENKLKRKQLSYAKENYHRTVHRKSKKSTWR